MWHHPGLNSCFSPLQSLLFLLQVQASWLQHDLGHLSVFRKTKWNHLLHKFVMCHLIVSPWKTSEGFSIKICVLKTLWGVHSTGGKIRVRNRGDSGSESAFHALFFLWAGGLGQVVDSSTLPAPRQTQLLPQGPWHWHAPFPLHFGEEILCGGQWVGVGSLKLRCDGSFCAEIYFSTVHTKSL